MRNIDKVRKDIERRIPVKPRILFIDIETAPSLGWYFDLWKEGNIVATEKSWYVLSVAWKWAGQKTVHSLAISDYPRYKKNKEDDSALLADVWELLNDAELCVAHNGDRFDFPKLNARFMAHGMQPPSPYKTIDTLKIARRVGKFDSNRLDALAKYFNIGAKLPTTGFNLWKACMNGDMEAWTRMKKYNKHDVVLLEMVYEKLRPWASTHPNLSMFTRDLGACPACGGHKLQKRGFCFNTSVKYMRLQCQDCGKWSMQPVEKVERLVIK